MPFKASNQIPADAFADARRLANNVKTYATQRATTFASGADAAAVLSVARDMKVYSDELNAIKAVPGIAQYAKDQEDDQTYDVVTEFNALIATVDAVITEIKATFPADGSGYLLARQFSGDSIVQRQFTAPQLAGLVVTLNAVSAAIS